MFCSQCGHQISENTKFCTGCGRSVSGEQVPMSQAAPASNGKQKIVTIQDIPKIKLSSIYREVFWFAVMFFVGLPLIGGLISWGLLALVDYLETG